MKTTSAFLALSLLLQSAAPASAQIVRALPGVTYFGPAVGMGPVLSAPALSAPIVPVLFSASSLLAPALAVPSAIQSIIPATARPVAAAAAAPTAASSLRALSAPSTADDGAAAPTAAAAVFDGALPVPEADDVVAPALEPRTAEQPEPKLDDEGEPAGDNAPKRPTISFQPAAKPSLLALEAEKSLYGTMKLVKNNVYSQEYWNERHKGVEVDIVIRGENIYSRPTKITSAVTKRIADLTREDFEGTVPKYMLQVGIAALRKKLVVDLDQTRKRFDEAGAPVVLESTVRVMKFQSYLEMFRETHGPDEMPKPEAPVARTPLKIKPEGALKRLTYLLPRAVIIDLDALEGPISKEILSDMSKLQRTGVYFVGLSRKPYAAAGSIKDKLVRELSAYQTMVQMSFRFLMVSDDGAVISGLPHGSPEPVDILSFRSSEIEVLRGAAQKAAEQVGIAPLAGEEIRQAPVVESSAERFGKKSEYPMGPDPRVRYEVRLPKSLTSQDFAIWRKTFDAVLDAQGVKVKPRTVELADGSRSFSVQRTDLADSMGRLRDALGKEFGLYLNPGDALVLTADKALLAANPKTLDVAKLSGLKGAELLENTLGLMLGEDRENQPGDLVGSASRIASFTRDRGRYLSEALIKVDHEEQNINFFSGHVVHAAMDWLIWNLQNGRRPTKAEFSGQLRERWQSGLREFKPVAMPPAQLADSMLTASTVRGESMYDMVVRAHDRKEILIGTETPNFFTLKDYARGTGAVKRRHKMNVIFDFVALRPIPEKPGHAKLVIYDFKTGPAKTLDKLAKDVQVLSYALFAHEKWVGENFPAPYLAGDKGYVIDDVSVEFAYNAITQTPDITRKSLDDVRRKIIVTLGRIEKAEQKLYGVVPVKKLTPKAAAKAKAAKAARLKAKIRAAKAKIAKAAAEADEL